jgi:hypothetical protein
MQFADFGHRTRVDRCVRMLGRIAEHPAGRVTEVFEESAELEGAYRFLEGSVPPEDIVGSIRAATLHGARDAGRLYVIVDGTSLSLTDRAKRKDFGAVGARRFPTRGLKVIDAIGVDSDGAPRGLLDLHVWARGPSQAGSKRSRRYKGCTEMQHWVEVIDRVADHSRRARVVPWFVIDREGDAATILRAVDRSNGLFTVRVSQRQRRCVDELARGASIADAVKRRRVIGQHFVDVPGSGKRRARRTALDVRIGKLVLDLHEFGARRAGMETYVVWARERRSPRGEERLDWMLFTNHPVASLADAKQIIASYCHRWRIEDFHKTWKSGLCRVEDTQLRKRDHVVRWAAMLAAVATRVERLKFLARTTPDEPATIGLTEMEIDALRAAKRSRFSTRNETIGDEMPTIATAVLWIAQFGGFHGRGTAKPGSITLGRGLEKLLVYTAGFALGVKTARKRG